NVTFAALQALLFALLLATYSIHFVVLSVLSGALWWSINWFAREVREIQKAEKEKESGMEATEGNTKKTPTGLDSTESDTETENLSRQKKAAPPASRSATTSASLQPPGAHDEARKRLSTSGDS